MKLLDIIHPSRKNRTDYLSRMPDDMIGEVLTFLSVDDQMKLSVTNTHLNASVNNRLDVKRVKDHVDHLSNKIQCLQTDLTERRERRRDEKRRYFQYRTQSDSIAMAPFSAFSQGNMGYSITQVATRFFHKRKEKLLSSKIDCLEAVRDSLSLKVSSIAR